MKLSRNELKTLIKNKLMAAGLQEADAECGAECMTWSHERGFASHGAVRTEYYSERIAKGGITRDPHYTWTQTGPCCGTLDGDNGFGFPVAVEGMKKAIAMAKENGVAIVGMANMSHCGSVGYFAEMAAKEDLAAISFGQSDPMVIPYGGTEPFYGTNPISFAAPTADGRLVNFDMATTVQAWGKILDKRSKNEPIPADWAVGTDGLPVTNPHLVHALVPIAGPKGYGLMMMVDVFSGVLLGVPFGKHVTSMYHDLSEGRCLGTMHIVIDPDRFIGREEFKKRMSIVCDELGEVPPSPGNDKVYYPGERAAMRKARSDREGIEVVDELVEYLRSDAIHFDRYDHKNRFAD